MENTENRSTYERIATGLGWFSIGLGVAEVVAPGTLANLIGIRDDDGNRTLLRSPLYGMRELAAGAGLLTQSNQAPWLWGRVAGDLMDISSLAAAFGSEQNDRTKLTTALAAVLGVTALDVMCARQLSSEDGTTEHPSNDLSRKPRTSKSVIVNRSPDEVYAFWHDFTNLSRFMKHLESVESTGAARTKWRAIGPAGKTFEWEAETVRDEPGREIAWRALPGSAVQNSGSVRFEQGPAGRGTIVRVQLEYDPPGGTAGAAVARLFWKNPEQMLDEDLRRFKQIMEVGEIVQSDASIHKGMHPAQPSATIPMGVRQPV